jgi:hypothetical protein
MVKYICDRWGKDVENERFAEVSVPVLVSVQPIFGDAYLVVGHADRFGKKLLCTDCIKALQIFLEGESNGTNAI